MSGVKLAPSILSADFTRLGEELRAAEIGGADWIHLDFMDGHFVPNLSFGPMVAEAVKRVTELPVDVHLMVERPEDYVERLAGAAVSTITVHYEATSHLHRVVQQIQGFGVRAGVAINPATPVAVLSEIARFVDLILVMTVNPGFGGQRFIAGSVEKVARVRDLLAEMRLELEIEVDGGVDASNAAALTGAGATVLVAGSAVFAEGTDAVERLRELRAAAG